MTEIVKEKWMYFGEFVTLMALLISLTALSIDTMLPALPAIASDLNVTTANQAQYIISFLFLGFTFGQMLYGPISDSFGRKFAIYIGLTIFIIGSIFSLIADNFTLMLSGRLLQGIGAAAPRVISMAIIRDQYEGRDMARVMSFIMAVFILVPVVAPSLGQAILIAFHWRMIFFLFLLIALTAKIWMYFRLPETLTPENRRPFQLSIIWQGAHDVLAHKITLGYTICIGFVFATFIGYLSSAQQIFQNYYNVGDWFSLYFAACALSIGFASLVNSSIVKRYGMRAICHYALICIILISVIFSSILLLYPMQPPLWQFMLYAMLTFFFLGLLFGNLNAMAMEPMGHLAGIASAVIGTLSSGLSLILGTIIGQLYDNTLIPLVFGFLCLGSCAFLLQLWLTHKIILNEAT